MTVSRPTRIDLQFAAVAVLLGVLAGFCTGVTLHPRPVAIAAGALLLVGVGARTLAKPWGSATVLAPVFLVPSAPPFAAVDPLLAMSVLTLVLAAGYWAMGAGMPRVSPWPLGAVGVLGLYTLLTNFAAGHQITGSVAVPMFGIAGVVLGASLAGNRAGLMGFAAVLVPCALLSLAEGIGVTNFWADVVRAHRFDAIALRDGVTRSTSTFGHPLIAGAVLAGGAAVLVYARAPRPWTGPVAAAICAGGSVATVSRSSLLGMAAGGIVIVVQSGRQLGRTLMSVLVLIGIMVVAVTSVPQLNTAFNERVLAGGNSRINNQDVRKFAVTSILKDLDERPGTLVFGHGIGAASRKLQSIGGINGFIIFDNQWITAVYDYGILPLGIAGVLLLIGIFTAARERRKAAWPGLVLMGVVMWFVDGLSWGSVIVLLGASIGMATSSERVLQRPELRAGAENR